MKNLFKVFAGSALVAAVLALSAPKAAAQDDSKIMIGSNVEYNMGIGFGVDFMTGLPDEYDWAGKAWGLDFSFNFAEFYWGGLSNTHQFYLTLGLENKSFRLRDDTQFNLLDKHLVPVVFPDADDMKMSALRVFSWNVGMGYRYVASDDFAFSLGPIVNFNTGSRIKNKWYDADGKKQKEKIKWGKQELITIEFMAKLEYHGIGLYVKYNPFPLFQEEFGPKATTWSVGLML
ncbi:MAG: hypothetical protein LIQ26_04535 [Bacteroidota bacterium]|nr:hypothetical protein [Bacteroidota bacterium]